MSSKDRKKTKKKSERQRKVQQKKLQADVKLNRHRQGYQPLTHDDYVNPDDGDEQLEMELEDLITEVEPGEFEAELVFSLIEYVEERDQLSEKQRDDLTDFACSMTDPSQLMDRLQGWNNSWMTAQYYAYTAMVEDDEGQAEALRQKAKLADPTNLQVNIFDIQDESASPELIEKIEALLKQELERFGPELYEPDKFGHARCLAGSSLRLLMLLSKTHYELGNDDEAIRYVRQCLKLNKSKTYLRRLRLISMLLELGRLVEANKEILEHESQFGLGLILPYAIALESYLRGDMENANEFLEIGMGKNLPFLIELIEQDELKANPAYQENPLTVAGRIGVELLGNAWKQYLGSAEWISERMAIKARKIVQNPSAKRCGLCGKTSKLTKTPCCGRWICDDNDQYVMFSYARNSCYRNHTRYTLCGIHFAAEHGGVWHDCEKCKEMSTEMYVYWGINHYNFEFLKTVPTFERQRCSGCRRLMDLAREGYTHKPDGIVCGDCEPMPEFGMEE